MLHHYWEKLWADQNWQEDERKHKAELIASAIKEKVNEPIEGTRPSLSEFQSGLKRISGTHGIDGWAACELKAIAAVDAASKLVWEAMETWEETSTIPDCVSHCKLVCVAKKDKRSLCPNEYRPCRVFGGLGHRHGYEHLVSLSGLASSFLLRWPGVFLVAMVLRPLLQWLITKCMRYTMVLA